MKFQSVTTLCLFSCFLFLGTMPLYGKGNDTRAAATLSQEEVLALHKELRNLVEIHEAPSAREIEIVNLLRVYPVREFEMTLKDGMPDESNSANKGGGSAARGSLRSYLKNIELNPSILPEASLFADMTMTRINDSETGIIAPEVGFAAPARVDEKKTPWGVATTVYRIKKRFPDQYEKYKDAKSIYSYDWLGVGWGFQNVVALADWIVSHPEVHNLKAPVVPGDKDPTQKTYLEKAEKWLLLSKKAFDHFERYRRFDDDLGTWTNPSVDQETHVLLRHKDLPVNRYMTFNAVYLATAYNLKEINQKKYQLFYNRAYYVNRRNMAFFLNTVCNDPVYVPEIYARSNQYGPVLIWDYGRRDNGTTEDQAHLGIDMAAINLILKYAPELIDEKNRKELANTLFSGVYDYENHVVFKGLWRNPQPRKTPVFRVYGPIFAEWVAAYMPQEAYDRFVTENLFLWDERLEENLAGRIDTYQMPFEIFKARQVRYGQK